MIAVVIADSSRCVMVVAVLRSAEAQCAFNLIAL
jgi:hypothetical protein